MATYLIGNIRGPKGNDGVSPTATVTQTSTGATITVTDAHGTTTADIRNGVDGDGHSIDLTPYATKTFVNNQISAIGIDDYATKTYVDQHIEADAPVTSVNGQTGDVVLAIPDASGMATQAWVQQQGYATQSGVETLLIAKQDVLTAGTNISIVNGVISAAGSSGSTYTAGDGIIIENDEISVDDTVVALQADIPDVSGFAETADLATVATSGSYNDLSNKPDLSGYATTSALTTGLAAKQDTLTAGANITIDANNVISAIGGSSSASTIYAMSDTNLNNKADLLAMFANDNPPEIILYSNKYYKIANRLLNFSNSNVFNYTCKYDKNPITGPEFLQFRCSIDYTSFISIAIQFADELNGNTVTVPSAPADKFPNASQKTLAQLFTSIGNNYATTTYVDNAVSGAGGGTTYTAGNGIAINNDTISVDSSVVALKSDIASKQDTLTAGNGIGIDRDNAIYVDSDVVAFKTMEDTHDGTQEYAATEIGFGGVTSAWCDADGNYTKDAWMNSAEIGIETLTYNRDDSVWEPDRSISINPSDGITFIDEPAGVTKSLNLNGREGTLEWDGSTVALKDDIPALPTYNAGDGILIEQQVATSSAGPLRSAVEPTNPQYNVSLNLARDGGLAIDANGALYADIDLSDYATQRDLDGKQDTLTAGSGITITNNVISATGGSSLPTAPSTDGTYFLTTTVSSGTATQSWVSIPAASGNNF